MRVIWLLIRSQIYLKQAEQLTEGTFNCLTRGLHQQVLKDLPISGEQWSLKDGGNNLLTVRQDIGLYGHHGKISKSYWILKLLDKELKHPYDGKHLILRQDNLRPRD